MATRFFLSEAEVNVEDDDVTDVDLDTDAELASLREEPGSTQRQRRVLAHLLVDRATGLEMRPSGNQHARELIELTLGDELMRRAWCGDERVPEMLVQAHRGEVTGPVAVVIQINRWADVRASHGQDVQERLLRALADAMRETVLAYRMPFLRPIRLGAKLDEEPPAYDQGGMYLLDPLQGRFLLLTVGISDQVIRASLLREIARLFGQRHGLPPELFAGLPLDLTACIYSLFDAAYQASRRFERRHQRRPTLDDRVEVGYLVFDVWTDVVEITLEMLLYRSALTTLAKAWHKKKQRFDLLLGSKMVTSLRVDPGLLRTVAQELASGYDPQHMDQLELAVRNACRLYVLQSQLDQVHAMLLALPDDPRVREFLLGRIELMSWIYGLRPKAP